MNERDILFGLHQIYGIGWKTIQWLRKECPHFSKIPGWLKTADLSVLTEDRRKALIGLDQAFIEERKEVHLRNGVDFITILDKTYPNRLRETAQPPWVLYYKGNPHLLDKLSVAVVGTRTPTAYGKKVAFALSEHISHNEFCVVSGLARGIDGEAHRGALKGEGSTIAVLGTGVELIYPMEHSSLAEEIIEKGLMLSEYPIGTKVHAGLFPQRNRIIAGLTLGTMVVEADLRSGSLITADQALAESRDIFAVPGPITSPKSQGTLRLLAQGAKCVTCAEDVLEEYRHMRHENRNTYKDKEKRSEFTVELTEDEKRIIGLLIGKCVSIDQLIEQTSFQFGHLHSILLSLQVKKQIVQQTGSTYTAIF